MDLSVLPKGQTYEHEYDGWLSVFKEVAESPDEVSVVGCPYSWAPLMHYLGASVRVSSLRTHFVEDRFVEHSVERAVMEARIIHRERELVEFYSALRPELVDALYKSDMEWKTVNRRHTMQKEFKVTCNGSFFRPEVLNYLDWWHKNQQRVNRCAVLVPCAADKPYPAPLHHAVMDVMHTMHKEKEYDLFIATGVLGLVPEWGWDVMPTYDSGLPNQWRLKEEVASFFGKHHYDHVVVYSDFYSGAIIEGLDRVKQEYRFPLREMYKGIGYLNLLSEQCLTALAGAL